MDRFKREFVSSDDRNLGTTRYLYNRQCVVNGSVRSTCKGDCTTHPDKTGTGMLKNQNEMLEIKTDLINLRRRQVFGLLQHDQMELQRKVVRGLNTKKFSSLTDPENKIIIGYKQKTEKKALFKEL